MSVSRRVVISFLVAATILFTGIQFWPYLLNDIIQPAAWILWLSIKTAFASVDQRAVWYALIFIALYFLFRFAPRGQGEPRADAFTENATLGNIEKWRVRFAYDSQYSRDGDNLSRELIYLLTSIYASKHNITNDFGIYSAMQKGEIPIPEPIHAYLFPPKPGESDPKLKPLPSVRKALQKRIRQWTGREKAEHYRRIDEVIRFLENAMENKK